MDTRPYYAGKWLKAEHLDPTTDTVVEITNATLEMVGDEEDDERKEQVGLHFRDRKQILGLNVTNASTLWDLFGYDSEDWIGQRISLWVDRNVKFGKKTVEGIRIRPRKPPARAGGKRKGTTSKGGNSGSQRTNRRRPADSDGD